MDFQIECLQAHNEYRKKHGVPPLKLNREMCRISQEWANHLIRKNMLQHSNNREYGENLFCVQSSNPNFTISGKEAVDNWYEEIKCHKFGVEPSSLASGHFSQVVWKESQELGVAFAKTGGKIVVVANYSPAGNIIGQFAENVLPPGDFQTNNNNIELFNDISKLSISATRSIHRVDQNVTEGNFEEDFLDAHNIYRKRHDPNFTVNGHTPVDTWYEEVKQHPFGKEPSNLKSGHFSQVVWKSSECLGVGVAKNSQGSIYVVANYSPAGNFVGHYIDNVPPVKPAFYGDLAKKKETPRHVVEDNDCCGDFSQFALDALRVHNEYRKKHGVPELILSQKLCKFAQEWADTCARTASLQHRANCPYGENIFSVYSSDFSHTPTARDAIKEWYDEVKQHTYGVEKVNQNTLHFTQVVWKNSRELGVGVAKNKKGQTYVVANYDPRGNYIGQFVDNVTRPRP
ncbi:hypothetical protein NQ314_016115 [Rhamnusium bicolor]|uniref:SCP domain-containing protein n=1 Tax=Rhamnusium bicolor TaxID=1586634 RepID=A0AAV8WX08_9CUCU|nr:hypothetical protein NQ314_016115 [Rhamnusium bicolor]